MARMLAPLFVVLLLLAQSVSAAPARATGTFVVIEGPIRSPGTEVVAIGKPAGDGTGTRACTSVFGDRVFGVARYIVSPMGSSHLPTLSFWLSDPGAGAQFTIDAQFGNCGNGSVYSVTAIVRNRNK